MIKSEIIAQDKLKVGLEIHQQLASNNKLFCDCKIIDSNLYDFTFKRNLRPTQSEIGSYDQAALFESKKIKVVKFEDLRGGKKDKKKDSDKPSQWRQDEDSEDED